MLPNWKVTPVVCDMIAHLVTLYRLTGCLCYLVLSLDQMRNTCYPNEEQIITGYPIDGAMGHSVGGLVRKLSDVCLHNNAIVARCILDTNIALWDTRTASAPSIFLVLLEAHYQPQKE